MTDQTPAPDPAPMSTPPLEDWATLHDRLLDAERAWKAEWERADREQRERADRTEQAEAEQAELRTENEALRDKLAVRDHELEQARAMRAAPAAQWDARRYRAAAWERAALLEAARDALETAGINRAHGSDDWPDVVPAIEELAADRDRLAALDDAPPEAEPAVLLRRAAALLRERATAATGGEWRTHDTHLPLGGHTATILVGERNDTELLAWLPTMSHEPWDDERNAWRNADWIATVHPGVGLALAAVFEAWARMGGWDPGLLHRVGGPETLAVARAVLGEGEQ